MNLLAFADAAAPAVEKTTEVVATTFDNSKDAVVTSFTNAWNQIISVAPQIVAMVVVVVIGFAVAKFVGKAVTTLAEKLGLQNAADQSGLADSMHHMGLQAQRAGDHRHDRLLAVDVRLLDGRFQHPRPAKRQRRHAGNRPLHSQTVGRDRAGGRRLAGRHLPAGRGRHERRSCWLVVCPAPGQRLLLRVRAAHLHGRLPATGRAVRHAREPDSDRRRRWRSASGWPSVSADAM